MIDRDEKWTWTKREIRDLKKFKKGGKYWDKTRG
jgi:hypothetical protein